MKRVRSLKKQQMAEVPMADSVAATKGEESSLPTVSARGHGDWWPKHHLLRRK